MLKLARQNRRSLVALLVTAGAAPAIYFQTDIGGFFAAAAEMPAGAVAAAGIMLLLGALLAVLRLWFITHDIGRNLSARDAMLALSMGQLAGSLTIQFFGQIAARSALLSSRGISTPENIAIASYERLVALAISLLLAASGGWYLFGHIALDLSAGGGKLLYLLSGMLVTVLAGACFAWGPVAAPYIRGRITRGFALSIARTALVTLLIQLTTACAYVALAAALSPSTPIWNLFAAALVVMFAASLPISFAGWGVRELSAILALTTIGVPAPTALAVAVMVGLLAMASIIIIAGVAVLLPTLSSHSNTTDQRDAPVQIEAVVKWALPLMAATAVFFQVYLPTATKEISINLADPIALLGGAMFAIHCLRHRPAWRLSGLALHVAAATLVMLIGLAISYFRFGFNDWAFTNKALGWPVLLAYGATGALIVSRFGKDGLATLARTFAFSAAAIVALSIVLVCTIRLGAEIPADIFSLPLKGFSQNRNAFAFMLLMAIAATPLLDATARPWLIAILAAGIILTGSRAGAGALAVMAIIGVLTGGLRFRDTVKAALAAASILVAIWSVPHIEPTAAAVAQNDTMLEGIAADLPPRARPTTFVWQVGHTGDSSNVERFTSWKGAFELFREYPVFGAGLGAYVIGQADQPKDKVHIIHSTALWLLAEFGLIGFLVFSFPAFRLLMQEGKEIGDDPVSTFIVLTLIAFAAMSIAHEMLYQRAFWMLLGAGLAYVPALPVGRRR